LDATFYSDIIFQVLESHSWKDKAADGVANGTGCSREDSRQMKKRFRIWPKKRELDKGCWVTLDTVDAHSRIRITSYY